MKLHHPKFWKFTFHGHGGLSGEVTSEATGWSTRVSLTACHLFYAKGKLRHIFKSLVLLNEFLSPPFAWTSRRHGPKINFIFFPEDRINTLLAVTFLGGTLPTGFTLAVHVTLWNHNLQRGTSTLRKVMQALGVIYTLTSWICH